MHPQFQRAKKTWWWIESRSALARFSTDSFAQGYELLRRSDRIGPLLAARNCPAEQTWKQLYRIQKDYFTINYRRTLVALSLHKRVWAGPGGITFDATQSNDSLIKALKAEIKQPTPFACGVSLDTDKGFRIAARFKPHPDTELVYVEHPSGVPLWQPSRHERQMVYVPLPRFMKYSEDRELTDREALAYFRNFIKDDPPPDFAVFRRSLQKASRHRRSLQAHPLALGLMAHDYSLLPGAELSDLAEWLIRTFRARNLFGLDETAIHKALYNGHSRVRSLLERLERP